jgi:uncharacterized protein (TIRG00374 family)
MVEHRQVTAPVADIAKSRAPWVTMARTAVGLALLVGVLLWNDNAWKLLGVMRDFEPHYIAALVAIALALDAISSLKWGLFIHEPGVAISQLRLFGLYLIGRFFNNFLPSTVGGDLARIYLLGRAINSHSRSFASVFLERATGVIAMTALAVIFALLNPEILANPLIALPIAAATMACAIAVALFRWPSLLFGAVGLLGGLPVLGKLVRKVEQAIRDVTYFRNQHRLLLLSLLYSLGWNLLASVNVYVACLSIGLTPSFLDILVITPVVLLLVMLPVSPNNIGWWEWCFSVLLVDAGATMAQGLAVALTLRIVAMGMSLIGGLLFLNEEGWRPSLRWRS